MICQIYEGNLLTVIRRQRLPHRVGQILDGNRRHARTAGLPMTCYRGFAATSSRSVASNPEAAAGGDPADGGLPTRPAPPHGPGRSRLGAPRIAWWSASNLPTPEPGCRNFPGPLAHGAGGRGRPPLRDLGIRRPLKPAAAPASGTRHLILLRRHALHQNNSTGKTLPDPPAMRIPRTTDCRLS